MTFVFYWKNKAPVERDMYWLQENTQISLAEIRGKTLVWFRLIVLDLKQTSNQKTIMGSFVGVVTSLVVQYLHL